MPTEGDGEPPRHLDETELEAGLETIRRAPKDRGPVRMIVRRPEPEAREVLAEGELDPDVGLVGDGWKARGYRKTPDGAAHPDMQLTLMNARVIALIAQDEARWPLAGDQLYVDLDLSEENLPPGTQLSVGDACIEMPAEPHTGCAKFVERFGRDAMRFVNSAAGRRLRLRGANARVVEGGRFRVGDAVAKRPANA